MHDFFTSYPWVAIQGRRSESKGFGLQPDAILAVASASAGVVRHQPASRGDMSGDIYRQRAAGFYAVAAERKPERGRRAGVTNLSFPLRRGVARPNRFD